jgi:hypothetical protein
MKRRDVLAHGALLAAGASVQFPAPAIAQGIRQLKMVTDWTEGTPGRPRRRASEECDELASAAHSMISSARSRKPTAPGWEGRNVFLSTVVSERSIHL